MKILLHVNYYEGLGKFDKLFEIADKNGYDGVELRWKYRFDDMTQEQYQDKVAQLKQQYPHLEIVFGGCVDFCRGSENEVVAGTDAYSRFLEWAKRTCGTKVMNFFTGGLVSEGCEYYEFDKNGSAIATEEDFKKSAAGLKQVGDQAAELDMLIALEMHNCYLHDLAAPSKKLMKMTRHDAVGMNYDQGNIILNKNGETVDEIFEMLDGKIYYAHLKNIFLKNGSYLGARLEAGHIDTMHVVDKLRNNLKSGMLALEYPFPGDGIIAAKRDMEYVQFIKQELGI